MVAGRFDRGKATSFWKSGHVMADGRIMGDPFLNYFALFLLFFVVVVLFYGIIAIHDIPYKIAESRHHPHQDAIHAAGWAKSVHAARAVAVPLDLGNDLPSRARLGIFLRVCSKRRCADGELDRAGGFAAADCGTGKQGRGRRPIKWNCSSS
jgi:hypothetical protein